MVKYVNGNVVSTEVWNVLLYHEYIYNIIYVSFSRLFCSNVTSVCVFSKLFCRLQLLEGLMLESQAFLTRGARYTTQPFCFLSELLYVLHIVWNAWYFLLGTAPGPLACYSCNLIDMTSNIYLLTSKHSLVPCLQFNYKSFYWT